MLKLNTLKKDFPASVVVFFVALPLCLGVAMASGAPLFSGLIAGIIGGIVVGALSGSALGVSGPAAGLTVIVLNAITDLGDYQIFLLTVIIAGLVQVILAALRAGVIGYFFPSSVIKGMLTGIGIIIVLKQIPHFFGYDKDPEGEYEFFQSDGQNTFSELFNMINYISPGALIVGIVSILILIAWDNYFSKKVKIFELIPGSVVAVIWGIIYTIATKNNANLSIDPEHLVNVPIPDNFNSFIHQFSSPNFSEIGNPQVWIIGITIAIVASLETLLSVEASDKMDPKKRLTPTNRELFAQGIGNMTSGLIGGLPVTQVVVRSSANTQSGALSKLSTILHGVLLLISVILIPKILNLIPLAVLAAILILVGYKLAKPKLFKDMYSLGNNQFIPFIVTVLGIIFSDLLIGISLGLIVGIIIVLLKSYQNSHFMHLKGAIKDQKIIKMQLAEEVTFFNKAAIQQALDSISPNSILELDVKYTKYLDYDIIEILEDFSIKAKQKDIDVKLIMEKGTYENPTDYRALLNYKPLKD